VNITVIGAGYVGLVTGACFAELGNHVTCVDVNHEKITNLRNGILPIYEPGLEPMVTSNVAEGRLTFVTSLAELTLEPQVIFIAVGTPSDADGSADMQYVLNAARDIGAYLKNYCLIVDKSTVPVGCRRASACHNSC
jgi:UDPglucose 6-dehydrogenase